ncbi:MAG: protein kinase [Pyrinomonadaceae bacterium]
MKLEKDTTISHYKILSEIGKGGMGEVYLANDTKLNRNVAIKFLSEEWSKDSDKLNRFVQEAQSASALNHPNIITVFEIGETANAQYIALEYIEGETLTTRLKKELKFNTALDIATQIASALDAAHAAGIVHRDIKPDNVMIRKDGLVKILDFGIAKLTEKSSPDIESEDKTAVQVNTSPGMIIGTANYMSPEQAKGRPVDSRTDIFSFGVVLYEMVSGWLPFEGESSLETIGSILKDEPKPLPSHEVPADLVKMIGKCLRKDPDERYQTMKGLLADLKETKSELEFQEKLDRTIQPERAEAGTQVFEATTAADAQHTTSSGSTNDSITIRRSSVGKVLTGVAAAVLIGAIGVGYWYLTSGVGNQIESIAVMPFVNEGGNADTEYLSDGMTETLISSLSKLPDLNVKGRSSVFRYKGKDVDTKTIAADLGVQAVLFGYVTQRGDRLSLSLELLDAATENVIWSGKYDRKQAEVVSLQSEIARDVSDQLRSRLSGADAAKVEMGNTANPEAYRSYLQGRFFWNKRTAEDLQRSIGHFNKAIELDPSYALAHAGLAETYAVLSGVSSVPPDESYPKARAAAKKALELDPNLAGPHAVLASVLQYYDWNQAEAEKEFKRAIELDPDYPSAHQWYGQFLMQMGRIEEGIAESELAYKLDPFSPMISSNLGSAYRDAGRYDDAIAQFKKSLEIQPDFGVALIHLLQAYLAADKYEAAIDQIKSGDFPAEKARELEQSFRTSGKRGFWQFFLELHQEADSPEDDDLWLAQIHLGVGDKEKALDILEKMVADGRGLFGVATLGAEVRWEDLRDEPRFKALLKKIGLID